MFIDGDPNLTELLFYSIKIQLSIEDLAAEIRNIRHSMNNDRVMIEIENSINLASIEKVRR